MNANSLSIIFAGVMLLIVFLYLSRDLKYSRLYRKALRSKGIVTEVMGTEKIHFYSLLQWRDYTKVKVEFMVQQKQYKEELLLKGKNVQRGDRAEVHFLLNKEGQICVLNDICTRRLRELLVAFVIAVPLCLVLIVMKRYGII